MNATEPRAAAVEGMGGFRREFAAMHAATRRNPVVDRVRRHARLDALFALVHDNAERFVEAIAADFGHRSAHETRLLELFPSLEAIRHTRSHFAGWMKPQRKSPSLWFRPGRARIVSQPLGVVGIIVPWNYPLFLAISPMAAALAAGNRVMVKMSEFTPRTGELLAGLVTRYFPPEEVAVVLGDATVGADFARLPFDHLLFTGSGTTGRAVMAAAARNLCPVTLELGGKAPAIVCDDYPLRTAAERILFVKYLNAGQICTTVDHAWLPPQHIDAFVKLACEIVPKRYPRLDSPDYSSIIDERSFDRLLHALDDARARGATLVQLVPGPAHDRATRKIAPHIVLNAPDDSLLMQREIFGPILPLRAYDSLDVVIARINAGPRPLAVYPFSHDAAKIQQVLDHVMSGGVTVNDALFHVGQHDLPFGGIGDSGMGHYHGHEGFVTFSKLRPVFYQARFSSLKFLMPPYGKFADRMLGFLTK